MITAIRAAYGCFVLLGFASLGLAQPSEPPVVTVGLAGGSTCTPGSATCSEFINKRTNGSDPGSSHVAALGGIRLILR